MIVTRHGRLGVVRAGLLAAGLLLCLSLCGAGSARAASFSFTGPSLIDATGMGQTPSAVACPLATQCTAVDSSGQEVTYNPSSPGTPTAVLIDANHGLQAISCPSATQCTAVDSSGELTFNPTSPGAPTRVALPSDQYFAVISCPTSGQCTTLSESGAAVSFDPATGSVVSSATVADGATANPTFEALSCPTIGQCTTFDSVTGDEVTFVPASGASLHTLLVDSQPYPNVASDGLDCVSTADCALGDDVGYVAAFDPLSGTVTPAHPDTNGVAGVSCVSTQCTEVDYGGGEVTFTANYTAGTVSGATAVHALDANGLNGVVCSSTTQCTGIDYAGDEVEFAPTTGAVSTGPSAIDPAGYLTEVSCGSSTECAAIDTENNVVTFNPASPGVATPVAIDANGVDSIACPTGTQCTVVDYTGDEVTFNPAAPAATAPVAIDPGTSLYGIACPSATQCTAADSNGNIVTFNPASPGTPTPTPVVTSDAVYALSCPSTTQCTGSTATGGVVTFNPTAPAVSSPADLDGSNGIDGLACGSTSQCTITDDNGNELTFNPASPGAPAAVDVDGTNPVSSLACPSASECLGVDNVGNAVTFDPAATSGAEAQALPGADDLSAVTCASAYECVAVDGIGDAFVATMPIPATPPAPPAPTAPKAPKKAKGAVSSKSASSDSVTGTTKVTEDGATVRTVGIGAYTVSKFTRNPGRATSFSASGQFFDVQTAAGSQFSRMTVSDCDVNGATKLHWLDGKRWKLVSPQRRAGKCIDVTLGAKSSPSLTQLTGTVFAPGYVTTVVSSFTFHHDKVAAHVHCIGRGKQKRLVCPVTLSLSVTETLKHGKLVAVSAVTPARAAMAKKTKAKKPATVHRAVVLASKKVTLKAGKSARLTLSLDRVGRKLLARRHHLKVRYSVLLGVSGHKRAITFRSK
jgi:hypothetical protein